MQVDLNDVWRWTYIEGLKHTDVEEVYQALCTCGKNWRSEAHIDHYLSNYWNGWHNADLYHGKGINDIRDLNGVYSDAVTDFLNTKFEDFEEHPNWGLPEVENRFFPCDADNHPMIKWSAGCWRFVDCITKKDAVFVGENLKGTLRCVVDCDGDHDKDSLDFETIEFLNQWRDKTHCMSKPKLCRDYGIEVPKHLERVPASFHLTFHVEVCIPTYHLQVAHIDILGNRRNQARFFKDKIWNGLDPMPMTGEIWEQLKAFVGRRQK